MSDLSWLNPTPHAIAVYASSPLSPAATQHSLPSGRYPLLGPDFHRLDRTSLRLAHSLNHLGTDKQRGRYRKTQRLRRFEIDDQIECGRLFHRQVGRLRSFQYLVNVDGGTPVHSPIIGSVASKPPSSTYSRYPYTVGMRALAASAMIADRWLPVSASGKTMSPWQPSCFAMS